MKIHQRATAPHRVTQSQNAGHLIAVIVFGAIATASPRAAAKESALWWHPIAQKQLPNFRHEELRKLVLGTDSGRRHSIAQARGLLRREAARVSETGIRSAMLEAAGSMERAQRALHGRGAIANASFVEAFRNLSGLLRQYEARETIDRTATALEQASELRAVRRGSREAIDVPVDIRKPEVSYAAAARALADIANHLSGHDERWNRYFTLRSNQALAAAFEDHAERMRRSVREMVEYPLEQVAVGSGWEHVYRFDDGTGFAATPTGRSQLLGEELLGALAGVRFRAGSADRSMDVYIKENARGDRLNVLSVPDLEIILPDRASRATLVVMGTERDY